MVAVLERHSSFVSRRSRRDMIGTPIGIAASRGPGDGPGLDPSFKWLV